jgi:pseudouridine-5'-phosphate glycosidase
MSLIPRHLLRISEEVAQALKHNIPVVALESTIIAHGMPWPRNLETAEELENIVREGGAVPATIAICKGECCVGLTKEELIEIASGSSVMKVSRRDLPWVLSKKLHGATTVSATTLLAASAGISFFATGGIGGVHRGFGGLPDVSADLFELAKCPVAVFSSGAKAILDLPATLEYLETLSVPVLGYRCTTFPAFYYADSGIPLDYKVNSVGEVVSFLKSAWSHNVVKGVLVANPVPESFSLDACLVERTISSALEEAREKAVSGKRITPFLLQKIAELSGGNSLNTNIALVKSNVALAVSTAMAWANS